MINKITISTVNNIMHACGIVLLAAGSSTRLGKPKQSLKYKGQSLLRRAVYEAAKTKAIPIIVVLGANAAFLADEVDEKEAHVIINKEWKTGMASSVIAGLNALLQKHPLADAVIFMMCDQPFVTESLLNDLIITQHKTGKPIVTSSFDDTPGPPALFHKSIFPELLQLHGDTGARMIIRKHINEVATVAFAKGNIDIDTVEDYEALLQKN
ncbi:MAG: nucleotidyltransferase family protein [Ginsengibacter sp.]